MEPTIEDDVLEDRCWAGDRVVWFPPKAGLFCLGKRFNGNSKQHGTVSIVDALKLVYPTNGKGRMYPEVVGLEFCDLPRQFLESNDLLRKVGANGELNALDILDDVVVWHPTIGAQEVKGFRQAYDFLLAERIVIPKSEWMRALPAKWDRH